MKVPLFCLLLFEYKSVAVGIAPKDLTARKSNKTKREKSIRSKMIEYEMPTAVVSRSPCCCGSGHLFLFEIKKSPS